MKITKAHAKAVACTLFGADSEIYTFESEDPGVSAVYFTRGIFELDINLCNGEVNVYVGQTNVGKILIDNPIELNFTKN